MSLWILYATAVGLLAGLAALLLERAARLHRRPARWIWAGGLAAAALFPFLAPHLGSAPDRIDDAGLGAAASPGTSAGLDGGSAGWPDALIGGVAEALDLVDAVVPWIWAAGSLALATALLAGVAWTVARRRRWRRAILDGVPVLVSSDFGPAVVGVREPEIVVPRRIVALPPEQRELVLVHEAEHRDAGDTRLLLAGLLAVIALPWNFALWWQLRRLRHAVEADCDRRVLRRGADARSYASLIVEMAERALPARPPAAALVESSSHTWRRLTMILDRESSRWKNAKTVFSLVGAVLLGVVACESPAPWPAGPDTAATAEASAGEEEPIRVQEGSGTEEARFGLTGEPRPLFFVDGVRASEETLDAVEVSEIESIEVSKGSAAVEEYGDEARGGVVWIVTESP